MESESDQFICTFLISNKYLHSSYCWSIDVIAGIADNSFEIFFNVHFEITAKYELILMI